MTFTLELDLNEETKGIIFILRHLYTICISQSAQAWITQFYLQLIPCLPFLRKRSPDGAIPN